MGENPRPAPIDPTMLKHISPLLTPDALHALASMGHGDTLAIVDAHFPAARVARQGGAQLVQLPGADTPALLSAVLALMPLDDATPEAAWTMQVIGDPAATPPAVADLRAVLQADADHEPGALERQDFYEAATRAFAVFQCGEVRTYGNVLLAKGVVREGTNR
jgi:L-fucose mutarotase